MLIRLLAILTMAWLSAGQVTSEAGKAEAKKKGVPGQGNLTLLKDIQIKTPLEKNSRLIREIPGMVCRRRVERQKQRTELLQQQ
jgi:hypothetical protein